MKLKLGVFILTCFLWVQNAQAQAYMPELYVGTGCPHCAKVEAFLEGFSQQHPQFKLNIYDVYKSRRDAAKLMQKFSELDVPEEQRGVPVLFTGKTYYFGDRDIINYFKSLR